MGKCPEARLVRFGALITRKMWQANGLMILNALLMGVVVIVGTYAPRFRHHPLTRFIFLGATTLFLPILSSVAGTIANLDASGTQIGTNNLVMSQCIAYSHIALVLIWTGLIVTIAINTSTIVATDKRENRNIAFPMVLVINAIWAAYLIISTTSNLSSLRRIPHLDLVFYLLYALTFSKLALRCCAFIIARRSAAFGHNPQLIAGHMDQVGERQNPPELVVNGEHTKEVEKQPRGYRFKNTKESKRLVTFDRIWKLDNITLGSEYKDLCFSFSLFKLLRCRFAKYTVSDSGFMKVQKFFHDTYLSDCSDKEAGRERVFRVVEDELSFIHDYYNSFHPISYWNPLLPFVSILLSLLSICYCSYMFVFVTQTTSRLELKVQINCILRCVGSDTGVSALRFGSIYFDSVPAYLVLAVLMLSEMRDIVVYICSKWTKVALICNHTKRTVPKDESVTGGRSPTPLMGDKSATVQKRIIGFVLKDCRWKLITDNWEDKMNQCSILAGSWKSRSPCTMFVLRQIQRLLPLPIQEKIMVHEAVKDAIFKALLQSTTSVEEGPHKLKHILPPSSPIISERSASHANSTADAILAWHVATSIFELKNPEQPESDDKIAATRLSCYCAYLVACHPELLPDDDKWCESLYTDAMKNANDVILAAESASSTTHAKYDKLVKLRWEDAVLKEGATLGEKLVQQGKGWVALADFWANMLLYLAPSENLDGHAEAIARGGELITLVWAMLAHDGIVARADATAAERAAAAANASDTVPNDAGCYVV